MSRLKSTFNLYGQVGFACFNEVKRMTTLKYQAVLVYLKEQIQRGKYIVGDYLPSENELCAQFSITRTTARKALDELLKEGFIEKIHGKGSRVAERCFVIRICFQLGVRLIYKLDKMMVLFHYAMKNGFRTTLAG
jgi:DNA-binding transcriptional MocR family regulator